MHTSFQPCGCVSLLFHPVYKLTSNIDVIETEEQVRDYERRRVSKKIMKQEAVHVHLGAGSIACACLMQPKRLFWRPLRRKASSLGRRMRMTVEQMQPLAQAAHTHAMPAG
jgi:hypothetical protein